MGLGECGVACLELRGAPIGRRSSLSDLLQGAGRVDGLALESTFVQALVGRRGTSKQDFADCPCRAAIRLLLSP